MNAEEVPKLLDDLRDPETRRKALVRLGKLGAVELTDDLDTRIADFNGLDLTFLVVALETLCGTIDDPAIRDKVSRALLIALPQAAPEHVWDFCNALWKITGLDPLVSMEDHERTPEAMREAWLKAGVAPESPTVPRLEELTELPGGIWSFQIRDGRGTIKIDHDPPTEGSSWPRWGRSVFFGNEPLYSIGSTCGTCEFHLKHAGWPARRAALAAEEIRRRLDHVPRLDEDLFETLAPLLGVLRSGHYHAALVRLPLEEIGEDDDDRSWWKRRYERRISDDPDDDDDDDWDDDDDDEEDDDLMWGPGTAHYQVGVPVDFKTADGTLMPGYAFLLPSQAMEHDPETLRRFDRALADDREPLALAVAWIEDRYVSAEYPERIAVSILIDGHHKTAASVARGEPARVLWICRLEDTWGPREDRGKFFRETVATLRDSAP